MTCFNGVHHFDLARCAGEAARMLTPAGQLVAYTCTPEQNRRTIWGYRSLGIVLRFELGWRNVPERPQQSSRVEPVHPRHGG